MHRLIRVKYLFLFIGFVFSTSSFSQLSHGQPSFVNSAIQSIDTAVVIDVFSQNNRALKSVYSQEVSNKSEPLRFAHPLPLNYSIDNAGYWDRNIDGVDVWHLALRSKGAYSLSLKFNKFLLPASGRLMVYNSDKSTVLGAFTAQNNRVDSLFSTAPISGDVIILEYTQDTSERVKPILSISQINHDFLDILKVISLKATDDRFGLAGDCNTDVTDDPNFDTTPQVRSVCKIIINGTELCSGTLLANTAGDNTIYFITAGHCFDGPQDGPNTLFYYNYESPHGESSVKGSTDFQTLGATLVAHATDMDFALLKLTDEKPLTTFRPYLSGWNRSEAPPAPYFAIHHPQGDVKKISKSLNPLIAKTYVNSNPVFQDNIHWLVESWFSGTTEGGSSGCGIFDATGSLVGTLSGGSAYCGNSVDDYFVRFEKVWHNDADPARQLQTWLDFSNISSINTPFLGHELFNDAKPRRISNIISSDSALFKTSAPAPYKAGLYLNSPYSKVAESFANMASKKIEGVYLTVAKRNSTSGRTVKLSFYDGVTSPENLLLEMPNISLTTLSANCEKFIPLPNGGLVSTSNNIFVAYELSSPMAGDTLSLFYSTHDKLGNGRASNSAFLFDRTNWLPFSSVYLNDKGSLWLDLVVSDPLNNSLFKNKVVNLDVAIYPNPSSGQFSVEILNNETPINAVQLVTLDGLTFTPELKYEGSNLVSVLVPNGIKGVVLIKVTCQNVVVTKKVLVR